MLGHLAGEHGCLARMAEKRPQEAATKIGVLDAGTEWRASMRVAVVVHMAAAGDVDHLDLLDRRGMRRDERPGPEAAGDRHAAGQEGQGAPVRPGLEDRLDRLALDQLHGDPGCRQGAAQQEPGMAPTHDQDIGFGCSGHAVLVARGWPRRPVAVRPAPP